MKKTRATLSVDGQEMTEKQLRGLFDQHGLRQESSYILEHLLPTYTKVVHEMFLDANNTEELWEARGAAKLLNDIEQTTRAALKKTEKVQV